MTHEDMLNINAGLVFHAQENCGSEKRYHDLGEFENRIQLLIYKDMPTLPLKVSTYKGSHHICPTCGVVLDWPRGYCEKCGQRLDWRDEE